VGVDEQSIGILYCTGNNNNNNNNINIGGTAAFVGSYILSKLRTAAERNDRRLSVLMLYTHIYRKTL